MTENLERDLIEIIATDRLDRPISSMSGKLKRTKSKLAKAIEMKPGDSFDGDRVYSRVELLDNMKARGMRKGIDTFKDLHPRYGAILEGLIAEQRVTSEAHLYFGMKDNCRITADDYLGVMTGLGFTETTSRKLYPELMDISRNLARKRDEKERSILIYSTI
tara:strand:+ start:948 stop:1433 length:486 start_codon:yes stop_codon:yes gene_type:complete